MKTILYNKKSLLLFNIIIVLFFSTRQYIILCNSRTDILILPFLVPILSIMKLSSKKKILKMAIVILMLLMSRMLNLINTEIYIALTSLVLVYSIYLIYQTASLQKPDVGSVNLFIFINSFLLSLLLLSITELAHFTGLIQSEKYQALLYFLQIMIQFYIIFYCLVLIIDYCNETYRFKRPNWFLALLNRTNSNTIGYSDTNLLIFNELSGLQKDIPISYTVEQLNNYFQNSTSYLNTNFSLMELSLELKVSPNHLSRVINTELHTNFYKLVSFHRIAKAKTLIEELKIIKIDAISEQVGFKSRITFNKYFKLFTGLNPVQYRTKIEKTDYKYF